MQSTNIHTADNDPLMVTIRCLTYNHEPYIRQCLEGFVMQKTNFRFEAIVHDDASTDGTAAIIREYAEKYPDIIKPIFETENQYSKKDGSLSRIMNSHMKGKYIAMCEGDDYWTDPLKLQKQVDFLESHLECGMCYMRIRKYYQKNNRFGDIWGGESTTFDKLLVANTVPTLTTMFRKELYDAYSMQIVPDSKGWLMGDYPMWLWFAHESSVAFIPDIVGVYRIADGSASHSSNSLINVRFVLNVFDIKLYFVNKFRTNQFSYLYFEKQWWLLLLAILEKDKARIKSHICYLEENHGFLRLKQRFILNLCHLSMSVVYYIVMMYINKYIGKR